MNWERAVTQLGFKGALINGTTNGVFFDDKRFWPICERAAVLDVPLYLDPDEDLHPAVIETYYKDYAQDWPMIMRAAWGFTVETATQGVRMLSRFLHLSEAEDHPGLSREGLPFLLWRIDMGFKLAQVWVARIPRTFFPRALPHHDQRLLLRSSAAVLRAGTWLSHHVLSRLSVRCQQAGHRLAADHTAQRRGPRQDRERQCGAAAEAVTDPFVRPEASHCRRRDRRDRRRTRRL